MAEGVNGGEKATDTPTCVILDANQWISSSMLRSDAGDALLYAIDRIGASLGLPEVVETEVKARAVDLAHELAKSADGKISHLARIMGNTITVGLPDRDSIARAIEDRIRWLNPMIERIPLSLEQVRRALVRVVSGHVPSNVKHEEFRDAAIWEAVVDSAQTRRVLFITSDSGFYEEGNPKKSLAIPLLEEITNSALHISVFSDLIQCAERLSADAPAIDESVLISGLARVIRGDVERATSDRSFSLGGTETWAVTHAPTKDPSFVAVSFFMRYGLRDTHSETGHERTDGHVVAKGECIYSPDSHEFRNVEFEVIEFSWWDSDGEKRLARTHFKRISANVSVSATVDREIEPPPTPRTNTVFFSSLTPVECAIISLISFLGSGSG